MVGPKFRVVTSATSTSMFATGQVILGAVAWSIPNWRYMIIVLHIPCFLIVSYYWILSESVRWLLSKHKYDEAQKVLEKVARINRKQISEKSMRALLTPPSQPEVNNFINCHKNVDHSNYVVKTHGIKFLSECRRCEQARAYQDNHQIPCAAAARVHHPHLVDHHHLRLLRTVHQLDRALGQYVSQLHLDLRRRDPRFLHFFAVPRQHR